MVENRRELVLNMDLDFIRKLKKPAETKIVFLVMDGLGGLPNKETNLTELETANTPNLDMLASKGVCGLQQPVAPGITPGSGPGHLALFGYDPIKYQVGRGVLSALGINFNLQPQDIACRGNFCSIDENGFVTDRRAGRIPTEINQELCELLKEIEIPGVEIIIKTVKEYRFLFVLRGKNLSENIFDTDPQAIGKKPLEPRVKSKDAENTASIVKNFIDKAREKLSGHNPANMIVLRGFSKKPSWPSMKESFGLNCAAIAAYPMYRGIAKLLGMNILETGETISDEFTTLENNWNDFDFFYLHIKKTDSSGEDGLFDKKVSVIEEVDTQIPRLINLKPDVIVVSGDHSTPSLLKYHSWHPVPTILWSEQCRPDTVKKFGERDCIGGGLSPRYTSCDLMPLALANANRLEKYGA